MRELATGLWSNPSSATQFSSLGRASISLSRLSSARAAGDGGTSCASSPSACLSSNGKFSTFFSPLPSCPILLLASARKNILHLVPNRLQTSHSPVECCPWEGLRTSRAATVPVSIPWDVLVNAKCGWHWPLAALLSHWACTVCLTQRDALRNAKPWLHKEHFGRLPARRKVS